MVQAINDDESNGEEVCNELKSKMIQSAIQRGGIAQRRGSNGTSLNSTSALGTNARINSFRDKLSKFKDASFRRSMKFTKGNRMDSFSENLNNSLHCPVVSKKRTVRFAKSSENVVHEIESFFDLPRNNIWWTTDELAASRSEGHILALTDPSVKKYISIYDQAQLEVHNCRKLSSDHLKELVYYNSKGYLGLEAQHNASLRIEAIRDHVLAVVRFNREQSLDNSTMIFNESFSSQSNCSVVTLNNPNNDVRSRNVRNYSSKMSASNRHFATAMGKVGYLASIRDK